MIRAVLLQRRLRRGRSHRRQHDAQSVLGCLAEAVVAATEMLQKWTRRDVVAVPPPPAAASAVPAAAAAAAAVSSLSHVGVEEVVDDADGKRELWLCQTGQLRRTLTKEAAGPVVGEVRGGALHGRACAAAHPHESGAGRGGDAGAGAGAGGGTASDDGGHGGVSASPCHAVGGGEATC